jgi:hypothetical protein
LWQKCRMGWGRYYRGRAGSRNLGLLGVDDGTFGAREDVPPASASTTLDFDGTARWTLP